jgi:opacity protein-like surface antigen
MNLIPRILLSGLLAVALLGLAAAASAQDAAAPEDHTADFKVLTTDFMQLDALFAQFKDPVHKVPTSGYISLLKQRAVLLGWKPPEGMPMGGGGGRGDGGGGGYGGRGARAKVQFDQVKYDELRYDINLQYQRIATYLAPLRTQPPPPAGVATFDLRAIDPNPANAAEVKAALDILDHELKRMESQVAMMAPGAVGRDDEVAKLKRVKERRAQLGRQFTAARWNELTAEFGPVE